MEMRTLRRIEPGEELTISYVDLATTREDRRRELREGYFFDCDCARCRAPLAPLSALSSESAWSQDDPTSLLGLFDWRLQAITAAGAAVAGTSGTSGTTGTTGTSGMTGPTGTRGDGKSCTGSVGSGGSESKAGSESGEGCGKEEALVADTFARTVAREVIEARDAAKAIEDAAGGEAEDGRDAKEVAVKGARVGKAATRRQVDLARALNRYEEIDRERERERERGGAVSLNPNAILGYIDLTQFVLTQSVDLTSPRSLCVVCLSLLFISRYEEAFALGKQRGLGGSHAASLTLLHDMVRVAVALQAWPRAREWSALLTEKLCETHAEGTSALVGLQVRVRARIVSVRIESHSNTFAHY